MKLSPGLSWAFLLSLLMIALGGASCGGTDTSSSCSPGNCIGCCDARGQCQVGIIQTACGAGGNSCDVCVGVQVCQAGRCQNSTPAGGGAGGGNVSRCNSTGVASGCTAGLPSACSGSALCYASVTYCDAAVECGGAGGGSGGGAAGGGTGGGTNSGAGARTVTGRITYAFVPAGSVAGQGGSLYFSQTVVKPVRNGVVRVVESGTTVLASTNTAEDGSYSLSFTSSGGDLRIQALTRTATPAIQVEDNTAGNVTWAMGASLADGANTLSLHATHGWTGSAYDPSRRLAAPFAVLDSMYTAARAFMAVRPVSFPPLKVNWSPRNAPQSGDKALGLIGTSHYSPAEKEIYVLGLEGADTDEFDSHVIVHEWGHYFERNVARSDSPGGPHGRGDVLDPRIAFGEAWGTALAAMVLPETMYTDTLWRSGTLGGWGSDAETAPSPTDDPTPSGFSENAMLRALYDLYDTNSDGSFDQVGVGLGPIYDVLTGPQKQTDALTTMASFITGLKAQPGANPRAIDAVMAHYNVGPVTSDFGTGDSDLAGMYTAAPIPFTGGISLGGGFASNSYQQNQYYVFTGTGRNVVVTASAAQDVVIAAYRKGLFVTGANATTSGAESFSFLSQSGVTYVVVLKGLGQMSGNYFVSLSITSP